MPAQKSAPLINNRRRRNGPFIKKALQSSEPIRHALKGNEPWLCPRRRLLRRLLSWKLMERILAEVSSSPSHMLLRTVRITKRKGTATSTRGPLITTINTILTVVIAIESILLRPSRDMNILLPIKTIILIRHPRIIVTIYTNARSDSHTRKKFLLVETVAMRKDRLIIPTHIQMSIQPVIRQSWPKVSVSSTAVSSAALFQSFSL